VHARACVYIVNSVLEGVYVCVRARAHVCVYSVCACTGAYSGLDTCVCNNVNIRVCTAMQTFMMREQLCDQQRSPSCVHWSERMLLVVRVCGIVCACAVAGVQERECVSKQVCRIAAPLDVHMHARMAGHVPWET